MNNIVKVNGLNRVKTIRKIPDGAPGIFIKGKNRKHYG
jgi:hypothetical protein